MPELEDTTDRDYAAWCDAQEARWWCPECQCWCGESSPCCEEPPDEDWGEDA